MANLESLPVSKGSMDSKYGLQKLKRYNHRLHNHNKPYTMKHLLMNYVTSFRSQGSLAKLEGDSADSDTQLTKLDVVLTFQLEVTLLYSAKCAFSKSILGSRNGSERSKITGPQSDRVLYYGSGKW